MAEPRSQERRRVYVSYPTADAAVAIRLIEDLRKTFGTDAIVTLSGSEHAAPDDLKREFARVLESCAVSLIVIGEDWVPTAIAAPQDPFNWTAFEIEAILADDEVVVIPVPIEAAVIPAASDMPVRYALLASWEAVSIADDDWASGVARIVARITELLEPSAVHDETVVLQPGSPAREPASRSRVRPGAADTPQPVFDENVQFTVFRPSTVQPQRWYPLLVFAHLAERRADADPDEPDPMEEVQARAGRALGDALDEFRSVTQDSTYAVMREGELRLIPRMKGIEFNPPERRFLWIESVHQEEFRLRAQASLDGHVARGTLTVYAGNLLLAEVPLAIRVDRGVSRAPQAQSQARPYRRIFASYSHLDKAIVEEFERHARAVGDTYLRDLISLRAGDVWRDRLAEMIRQADVFQLFWSWNALASPLVRAEWQQALALNRAHFVRPVYWEEPLPERADLPPAELRKLHFQRVYPRHTIVEDVGAMPQMAGGAQGPVVVVPSEPSRAETPPAAPAPAPRSSATMRLVRRGSIAAAALLAIGLSAAIFGIWPGDGSPPGQATLPSETPPGAGPPPGTGPVASNPPVVAVPSPVPAPPSSGVSTAAPGSSLARQLQQVLREYENGWSRRDIAALRRVWSMSDEEVRRVERVFRTSGSVEVRVQLLQITSASASHASARAIERRTATTAESSRSGSAQRERIFEFEKRGGEWMIVAID